MPQHRDGKNNPMKSNQMKNYKIVISHEFLTEESTIKRWVH